MMMVETERRRKKGVENIVPVVRRVRSGGCGGLKAQVQRAWMTDHYGAGVNKRF